MTSEAVTNSFIDQSGMDLKGLTGKVKRSSMHIVQKAAKPQEEKMDHDPLNLLGIGIVAQFDLMRYLIFAFTIFSLLSIPMIMIYQGYDAMKGTKKESYTASTLGNFGFSTSACYSVPKKMETMILFCNTGALSPQIGSYGIMPHDAEDKNYCINGFGDSKACEHRASAKFVEQYNEKCSNQQF